MAWLCKALDVSRSGFHAWLNRSPSKRALEDETLLAAIRQSFTTSDRTYGARRVWNDEESDILFDVPLHIIIFTVRARSKDFKIKKCMKQRL
jgi:putative transposase